MRVGGVPLWSGAGVRMQHLPSVAGCGEWRRPAVPTRDTLKAQFLEPVRLSTFIIGSRVYAWKWLRSAREGSGRNCCSFMVFMGTQAR